MIRFVMSYTEVQRMRKQAAGSPADLAPQQQRMLPLGLNAYAGKFAPTVRKWMLERKAQTGQGQKGATAGMSVPRFPGKPAPMLEPQKPVRTLQGKPAPTQEQPKLQVPAWAKGKQGL